jgi:hypothetical protein
MGAPHAVELREAWFERLSLSNVGPPQLFTDPVDAEANAYAHEIEEALSGSRVSSVYCVGGVPTIAFLVLNELDYEYVESVHRRLWHQGLLRILVVLVGDEARLYSLECRRSPRFNMGQTSEDPRHFETLKANRDTRDLSSLRAIFDDGQIFRKYSKYFYQNERIDNVLLTNILETVNNLERMSLDPHAAECLTLQSIFISYLEDRGIITEDIYLQITENRSNCLVEILRQRNLRDFDEVFRFLHDSFQREAFSQPCSFTGELDAPSVNEEHLGELEKFRRGSEDLRDGQFLLWGYDFSQIPVSLLSIVYERFLKIRDINRKHTGSYYTPRHVVDYVLDHVSVVKNGNLSERTTVLDPACGSGIFLVRMLQRYAVTLRYQTENGRKWRQLCNFVQKLRGYDTSETAVNIATFSLYIAMLEQMSPRSIRHRMSNGNFLPKILNKCIFHKSFFQADVEKSELIIGNPPWASRHGSDADGLQWAARQEVRCPSKEIAWAFVWRCRETLVPDGEAALLLPAMAFLHNHSDESVKARTEFVSHVDLRTIIDFSDLSFHLFGDAKRPACLICYKKSWPPVNDYYFQYIAPKASPLTERKHAIVALPEDRCQIRASDVLADRNIFNRMLWSTDADLNLLSYLNRFSELKNLVREYKDLNPKYEPDVRSWVIGQGYQPSHAGKSDADRYDVSDDRRFKFPKVTPQHIKGLSKPVAAADDTLVRSVRRKGFVESFEGAKILIPQGVERRSGRLRACFTDENVRFQHSLQAIGVPRDNTRKGKILTAYLNSKLVAWYLFHESSNVGSDRSKVTMAQILDIPFLDTDSLHYDGKFQRSMEAICDIVDGAEGFVAQTDLERSLERIDAYIYELFGLSQGEIDLIEDTVNYVSPSVQPKIKHTPALWYVVSGDRQEKYGRRLLNELRIWFDNSIDLNVHVGQLSNNIFTVCIEIGEGKVFVDDNMATHLKFGELFKDMSVVADIMSARTAQSYNFKIFSQDKIMFFKLGGIRYWLEMAVHGDVQELVDELSHWQRLRERTYHATE